MSTHELLGFKISADPIQRIKVLSEGLPHQLLGRFKKAAGLPDNKVAELLQIGPRTLTRVKASDARRLSADLSGRLYAVASIYQLADDVFGNHEIAVDWLSDPQFALGNLAPIELLSTELGRQQVRELLNQIEHGLLA